MVTVKQAEKMLEDVPHGRQFIIHNGASVKNLKELGEAVSLMPDNSFHYHVSNDRNDIAEWVRDTVGDWHLADSIEKAESKKHMAQLITHRSEALSRSMSEHSLFPNPFMISGANEFLVGIVVGVVIGMILSVTL